MNDAVDRFRRLLQQYPDNALARFSLGKAHYEQGQYDLAAEQFQAALGRKPDWMAARILLGKCRHALGDIPAARESYRAARELALAQHHEGPLAEMNQLLEELG